MLQPAINVGLSETDFWEMTKAEIDRYLEGAVWRLKMRAQFDYKLADLIGVSVARLIDSNVSFPGIHEVYPIMEEDVIEAEQEKEAAKMESSINNFLAFANRHNAKMNKGVENN